MHKPFEHLLPKIVAGGLSAGLVLVWWPALFAQSSGAASWVWRGLVWTLIFELLLGLLIPLQEKIGRHWASQKVKGLARSRKEKIHARLPESTAFSATCLALAALALPAGLIISGPDKAGSKPRIDRPVKQTKIVKPVKVVRVTKVIKEKEIKIVPKVKREVRVIHVQDRAPSEPTSADKPEAGTSSDSNPAASGE